MNKIRCLISQSLAYVLRGKTPDEISSRLSRIGYKNVHIDIDYVDIILALCGKNQPIDIRDLLDITQEETSVIDRGSPKDISEVSTFGTDLTKLASLKKLPPVFGREKEMDELCRCLIKRNRTNPILVGPPGCGKSAIVEGFVQEVFNGYYHELEDHVFVELSLHSLMANSGARGDLEGRINRILHLAEQHNIVLFIDEFHILFSNIHMSGIADMLKPAMGRGKLKIIAATTNEQYQREIHTRQAIARRLSIIKIKEPNRSETIDILKHVIKHYSKLYEVTVPIKLATTIVDVATRYISGTSNPDRSIELLNRGCAITKFISIPKSLRTTAKESRQHYDMFIENQITKGRDSYIMMRDKRSKSIRESLTEEDIIDAVVEMTGIPKLAVSSVTPKDMISNFLNILSNNVCGQEDAKEMITNVVKKYMTGVRDPKRPACAVLFCGPTGVGKTETAKVLAKALFGTEDRLIRYDMSEYQERHHISRLLGAPPGFVGFEQGGDLVKKLNDNPYCVLLFDEFEKAHPDIYHVFLQLFEEGEVTGGTGIKASAREALIIMTSNLGASEIGQVGFGNGKDDKFHNAVENHFTPEFLGRLDDVIQFTELTRTDLIGIARIQMEQFTSRLTKSHANSTTKVTYKNELLEWIVDTGYDKAKGGRSIRTFIRNVIETVTADHITKDDQEHIYIIGHDNEVSCNNKEEYNEYYSNRDKDRKRR